MTSEDRLFGVNASMAIKVPCRVATTAAITLEGEQTIDGVAVVTGDRVLVKDQASGVDNGVYTADTSEWSRATDWDGTRDICKGTLVRVTDGTLYGDSYWTVASSGTLIVGTTSVTFEQTVNALAGVSAFMETMLDDADASTARGTLGLNAGGAGDIWVEKAGDTMTGALVLYGEPKAALQAVPLRDIAGYLNGLTLSNNSGDATNDIDIATGIAVDSTGAVVLRLASGLTKRLDANWAVGTNQGMRNSAAAITDTTYHIYLVGTAAGAEDIYAHTSATVATVLTALQAETGGASYAYARRIGSIIRASSAIVGFVQDGDLFTRKVPAVSYNATNPGTSAVTATLNVPVGVRVRAKCSGTADYVTSGLGFVKVSDLSITDTAVSASNFSFGSGRAAAISVVGSEFDVMTDTSAQVRFRTSISGASDAFAVLTNGWFDTRGRL